MILSFKKQFVEKILSGEKIHTIREDKPGRWVADKLIHFATGVRTAKYHCYMEDTCKSVQSIQIQYFLWEYESSKDNMRVLVNGGLFYNVDRKFATGSEQMELLAKNDGFDSIEEFFKWFDSDFEGVIIHWTDFRY